jgi:hypothetical protein
MNDASPITEPIELTYALQLLPPGRIGFRRWRWELWHGAQLIAAGWRLTAPHAQRALRTHASRYAHRLRGLHPLRPEAAQAPESPWRGQPVTVECGPLRVLLTPRAVRERHPQVLPASG